MRTAAIAALVLLVASGGWAQATAPSAGQLEAAGDLLEAARLQHVFTSSLDSMLKAQIEQNPHLAPFEETMREFFDRYMSWEGLRDDLLRIYAEAFTEAELKEIIAFYRTRTGQKAVELMPALMNQGMALGQQRVQEHLPELQTMLQERAEQLQQRTTSP